MPLYILAYEEYEARFLEESPHQEYNHQIYGHTSSDFMNNQRYIDPDNMTYEELLRIGEEVGDVKKDMWRQKSCEVLSSLPTHHWTLDEDEDTYVFSVLCHGLSIDIVNWRQVYHLSVHFYSK
ncbi:hypothetical protein PsorP6_015676 [Peronosclerospora sorghi]|uniref:Uncharacterized protein n=1 Tax=Peronosclerospora sorghi TaxID=230839 RepID=A0ACC0WPU0_9STRA|nr:hypothetical protein PsorP6_015676 [Peronosclerospora sorghi]